MSKFWRLGAMLLALTVCGTVGCSSKSTEEDASIGAEIERMLINEPVREISGLNLQGDSVSLSGLKGKVVLLNFWGSWCGPCRMEAPALAKMRDELQGKGFEILGVNYGDQRSEALAFMAAYRMSFPVILDEGFTDLYRISGFPSNIVIDRHGRIRYRAEGYHPQEIARLRYIIEHLLSASS